MNWLRLDVLPHIYMLKSLKLCSSIAGPVGFIIFVVLMIIGSPLYAQRSCGTPQAIKDAEIKYPQRAALYQKMQQQIAKENILQTFSRGGEVAVIPVVVHIVLKNPGQVSDEQVQSQINVLNTDYNAENADSSKIPTVWKSLFGNMRVEFCLAERTPDGNPSNGIERVTTDVTTFSITDAVAAVKHVSSGGANAWDTKKYMNIWVCNLESGTLGLGTPPGLYPDDEDGIVVQYNAFGTTENLQSAFNEGRTCTHEVGHYFNLLHPWGDGDGSCSPGDGIDDTPPESEPVYGCPVFPVLSDKCSPDYPGVMFNNFMGYANDSCMNLFTLDQVKRAQSALLDYHGSLLRSDGCQPVILKDLDAKMEHILSPHEKICDNTIAPVITVKNMGKDKITRLDIHYRIDGGPLTDFSWHGSLNSLDTLELTLPSSLVQTANHTLTVFTALPNGLSDEAVGNDTAQATFHLDPEAETPFSEGFETDSFPPAGWQIRNPDGAITWQKTDVAAHEGHYAVVMRNLDYAQNGPTDDLISPVFNIQDADSAFLFFDVAAAVQSDPNGSNQYWDTLEVLISYDCAETGTGLYKKWGKSLITDTLAVSGEFVPQRGQWRRDSINLTPYLKNGRFQIIFRNITNFENNIYLDDINLISRQTNPILEKEKVLVVPNPTTAMMYVQFLGFPESLKAVSVYNSIGQLVFRKRESAVNTQNRIEFNLANEPNGVYFVKISFSDHTVVKKIVKIR